MKGFYEQHYPHVQNVLVTFDDGEQTIDAIKGLNQGHALYKARWNWPAAIKVEPLP